MMLFVFERHMWNTSLMPTVAATLSKLGEVRITLLSMKTRGRKSALLPPWVKLVSHTVSRSASAHDLPNPPLAEVLRYTFPPILSPPAMLSKAAGVVFHSLYQIGRASC